MDRRARRWDDVGDLAAVLWASQQLSKYRHARMSALAMAIGVLLLAGGGYLGNGSIITGAIKSAPQHASGGSATGG